MAERTFKEIKKLRELTDAELNGASGGWILTGVTGYGSLGTDPIKDVGGVTNMGNLGKEIVK